MNADQRRRFLPFVFVGVAVVIVLLFSRHQPVSVEAAYRLGGERSAIVELGVTWKGAGGKETHASYNYHGRKVPRVQSHEQKLPPDEYAVTLTVSRDDGTVTITTHHVTIEDDVGIELAASPD